MAKKTIKPAGGGNRKRPVPLAQRVNAARTMSGWSREALAEMVGVSATYIQKIEGGHVPSDEVLLRLASILDEDPAAFLLECRMEASTESVKRVYLEVLDKVRKG